MFEHVWVLISILQSLIHSADICWAPSRWKAHTKDFRNKGEPLMVSVAEEPEDWWEDWGAKALEFQLEHPWNSAVTFAQIIKMVHGIPLCALRTPDPLSRSPRVDYLLSVHLIAWAFTPQSGCISILYWCFSFWLTSLCIIGSSFIHLIRTDSYVFFLIAE